MQNGPDIIKGAASNVFVKHMTFKNVGDALTIKPKFYDVTLLISKGWVDITIGGHTVGFAAPQLVLVRGGSTCIIKNLESDSQVTEILAIRDEDGEIVSSNTRKKFKE